MSSSTCGNPGAFCRDKTVSDRPREATDDKDDALERPVSVVSRDLG